MSLKNYEDSVLCRRFHLLLGIYVNTYMQLYLMVYTLLLSYYGNVFITIVSLLPLFVL